MALNVKRLEVPNHPEPIEHIHDPKLKMQPEDVAIDLDKNFREDRPKDHNIDYEKILLKINIISK